MTALLTPIEKGPARQAGASLWRKQLLPVGTINYKGRRINFSREYLASLVRAFQGRAYDQVPFQLADAANTHTNDPERFRGTIRGLELTADGLDLILAPTPDGAKVLAANPDLGVSARIVEDYERADGRHFPAAVQHVLGTLDPRITGMRPWQAIEAANAGDDGEVIDLTAAGYDGDDADPMNKPAADTGAPAAEPPQAKETGMALTPDQEAKLSRLLDLPDDQFAALLTAAPGDGTDPAGGEGGEDGEDGDPAGGATDEFTDEYIDSLLAEINNGENGAGADPVQEPVLAGAGAELSAEAQAAIELANARAEEAASEVRGVRHELDLANYTRERDALIRRGVPARFIDDARPLLIGTGRTVELANGAGKADAGAITRKLLNGFAETMSALGLAVELGNEQGRDGDTAADHEQAAAAERGELVSAFRNLTGV